MSIPPPALAVSIALSTLATSRILEPIWLPNGIASCCALLLAALGTALDVSAKGLFVRQGTTVNPMTPGSTTVIVRAGAYRWSRNPMYLGRVMQLFALAIYLGNLPGLLGALLFAIYLDRVQIPAEEQALTERFSGDYLNYRSGVRRWL
ncbi:isoprenylcysteine carboxylmethyltransferase family protein [Dyella sp. RRB7]|uniref:methyltransferase family protein n=1 Tax=Dyella sp. RRB7 TaxID=2919502 RepID=UPI001FA9A865